ncbi:MAG: dienelactone hydrolase family protein [Planctomycetales bacterium]|nr:dienelactone hydrolase family protein [Planctomycetales bacterium]
MTPPRPRRTSLRIPRLAAICMGGLLLGLLQEARSQAVVADDPPAAGATALRELRAWLDQPAEQRQPLTEQAFANAPLSKRQAEQATEWLREAQVETIRAANRESFSEGVVRAGETEMKFAYRRFGRPGRNGRSLYISMHGGGGAPERVNDQQWENQKRLYEPAEGIYVAPRAPGNTWDLWHQGHIDPLFDQLIAQMIVFEQVDPNRVYLMGYSAGGDGVYQVAPRMADRFAAAAMMAGHPNETSPLGLRNLPFALYCGGRDTAYQRNEHTERMNKELDALRQDDPAGYLHRAVIYPDKAHWMDREDAEAVPWMAEFTREAHPDRIVWKQDDVIETRFYWLAMSREDGADRTLVTARRDGQVITIEEVSKPLSLTIRFDDSMIDFDQPVKIVHGDQTLFEGELSRTISMIDRSLSERADPTCVFTAEVSVEIAP